MADRHAGEWLSRRVPPARARLRCAECGVLSDERARGWRAYVGGVLDLDDEPEVLVFCPGCDAREFDA
jgi:hypothetical protein